MWTPLLLLLGEEDGAACDAGVFLVCASCVRGVGEVISMLPAQLSAVLAPPPCLAPRLCELWLSEVSRRWS